MGPTNLRTKLNLSTGIGKFNVLKRKGSAAAAAKALRTKLAGVGSTDLGLESENGNGTGMGVGGEIGLGIGISGEIGIVGGGGGTIRGRKKKGGRGQVRKGEAVVGSVDYNSRVVGRMTRGRDGSVRVRKSTKVKTKTKAKRVDENENAAVRVMGAGGGDGVDAITNSGGCCVEREGEGGEGEDKTLLSKLGAQAGKRRVVLLESLNLNLNADGLKEVRRRLSLNLHPAKRRGEVDENSVDSPMEVSDTTSSGGRRGLSRRATGSTSSLRLLYRKFEKGGNGL